MKNADLFLQALEPGYMGYPDEPHIYTCVCGYEWQEYPDDMGPLGCPKCGTVQEVEIDGIGDLSEEQLGKSLGKYSYCSVCDSLTLNVLGTTYCERPFDDEHNDPNRFFACADCGAEKFWQWAYMCPRCDSDSHAIISIGEPHYNYGKAMEFSGNPMDWEEDWKCLVCGLEYGISNSNC